MRQRVGMGMWVASTIRIDVYDLVCLVRVCVVEVMRYIVCGIPCVVCSSNGGDFGHGNRL